MTSIQAALELYFRVFEENQKKLIKLEYRSVHTPTATIAASPACSSNSILSTCVGYFWKVKVRGCREEEEDDRSGSLVLKKTLRLFH